MNQKTGGCVYHKILTGISQNLKADNILGKTLEHFSKIEDLNEKFQIIDKLKCDGYFKTPPMQPSAPKNNEESTIFRNLGNKQFERGSTGFLAALRYYNKSICYAENDSEELGLGIANRSAVYFELGLYDDCLNNIQIAKQWAPARIMDKLNNREKQCFQREVSARNSSKPIVNPELSFPANHQIPFIVNCLELQRNEQYGRHIITRTDLKPGDVVAIEEAFCTTLQQKWRYVRCESCLKENNYNLLPCSRCTTVMFCAKCRDDAYDKFHTIECPIIDFMDKLLCKSSFITFRTVVRAITCFGSADALITFIEETLDQDLTIFDCNYKKKSSHNFYAPVHFAEEKFDADAEFAKCLLASLISQALLELTDLKDTFREAKAVCALKGLVHHHINRTPNVRSVAIYLNGGEFDEYAEGIYPFRNLLNHSCAPNVMVTSLSNKLVYTVSKPIKTGGQLFDNYDVSFKHETKVERQRLLKYFVCQCEACVHDYPLESEIPKKNVPNFRIVKPLCKNSLASCAQYLKRYGKWYPCTQLLFAETEFVVEMDILYNERSMELRFG